MIPVYEKGQQVCDSLNFSRICFYEVVYFSLCLASFKLPCQ